MPCGLGSRILRGRRCTLPAAPWHQQTARCRRRQASEEFKTYPICFFYIDIGKVQTAELYVAIDRTSKFAFVQNSVNPRLNTQNHNLILSRTPQS